MIGQPTPPPEPTASEQMSAPLVDANTGTLDPAAQRRYDLRFLAVYGALGAIAVGAVVAFVIVAFQPGHKPAAQWASWQPEAGPAAKVTSQIADHVSHKYKLNQNGAQLVAVVPSKPTVTSGTQNIAIKAIAIRKAPQSNAGIEVLNSNKSTMYTFCGLGDHCAIEGGKATALRGRLVRREALEVALYTFKFVPSVDSVIAFMPPPPGKTDTSVLFLRKDDFKDALNRPLVRTLRLANPPLPTQNDATEGTTIDNMTLPSLFSYELTALQTGGAALVLDPTAT
jgi:hypothetical protein